ncbi:TPA_asm: hypothetical protein GZX72_14850 [Listeria monocytogenes]|nr:hypothetical protein [Listeria monocytogenes]
MKKLISSVLASTVLLTGVTVSSHSNEAQAKGTKHGGYVAYKVTNHSPRGSFSYKTADVYMSDKKAKAFAAKSGLSIKTALANSAIGFIPWGQPYTAIFGASKSVGEVAMANKIYKVANKNNGVHLRFEKGQIKTVGPWNGTKKNIRNSIHTIKPNHGVSQQIKILRKSVH